MKGISTELILGLSYAAFLVILAGVLELVARHVHRRSERANTTGFTYLSDLDRWQCPDGRHLHRTASDPQLKVIQYRAEAHHCNACVFKFRCTDADSGRVIEYRTDSWLDSGLYRFHRGMSLALLVLAVWILIAVISRDPGPVGNVLLVIVMFLVGIGTLSVRLFRGRRREHDSIHAGGNIYPWLDSRNRSSEL